LPDKLHAQLAGELSPIPHDAAAFLENSVSADCGHIFAFGSEGTVQAILLADDSVNKPTDKIDADVLRNAIDSYVGGVHATQFNMATQFVRRLFHRDQSLTDFFEGYLSLLFCVTSGPIVSREFTIEITIHIDCALSPAASSSLTK
jgi:hypothetical protein